MRADPIEGLIPQSVSPEGVESVDGASDEAPSLLQDGAVENSEAASNPEDSSIIIAPNE